MSRACIDLTRVDDNFVPPVTYKEFWAFERVRLSGQWNMVTDKEALLATGLSEEVYLKMLDNENYWKMKMMYPKNFDNDKNKPPPMPISLDDSDSDDDDVDDPLSVL